MPIFAQMTQSIPTLASTPSLSLAAISPMLTNLLIGVFLLISIVMILLVLIQRPQGGGLSGAFGSGGGGGAGQTAFGTKTGDVLTWATIGIFVTFLGFAIVLNFATRPPKPNASTPIITAPTGSSNTGTDGENPLDLSGSPLDLIDENAVDDAQAQIPTEAPAQTPDETPVEPPADLPAGDE